MSLTGTQPGLPNPVANLGSPIYEEIAFLPGSGNVIYLEQQYAPGSWICISSLQKVAIGSEAPTTNQVLTAVTGSSATWQNTQAVAKAMFDAYDGAVVSSAIGSTWQDLNINTETVNTGEFTLASDEVQFGKSGSYLVSYHVTTDTMGTTRTETEVQITKDTGGGHSAITGKTSKNYNRTSGQGATTASASLILPMASGDKIKLQVKKDTVGTAVTVPEYSSLLALEI